MNSTSSAASRGLEPRGLGTTSGTAPSGAAKSEQVQGGGASARYAIA